MKRLLATMALAVLALCMVSPSMGQTGHNLVVNGSFEADPCTGTGPGYKEGLVGGSVTGWFIPASDTIYPWCLQNMNGFSAGPAASGNQWLVLGRVATSVSYTIQQTLTGLTPGGTYNLSFAIASESGCCSVAEVSFPNGSSTAAQTFTAPSSGNYWKAWATKTMNFTATSSSVTLQFKNLVSAQTGGGGFDLGLDSVDVESNSSNSSDSRTVQFSPSAIPETQIATVGVPSDPAAQSLALTLASVTNAINVTVTFFYEPTDISTGTHGVGIGDGVCELNATEAQDVDCRLAANFTYPSQTLLPAGDRLVPHIIPSHNNLGVWVRVTATRVSDGQPAVAGIDYSGPVDWYYAWNSNPPLVGSPGLTTTGALFTGAPNPDYPAGWNNQNPQMYDRPGENVDIAFTKNITTFSKSCTPTTCVGTADPGSGGRTKTLNDIVVAAPPNPPAGTAPRAVELRVPVPGTSPFPYRRRSPMLVAFELENESKEKSDKTALTPPHSVSVATLLNGVNIPVQYPEDSPTTFTYNPSSKVYYIFLSPAPYKTDGTVYTLQINSDLFPQPVTVTFVVKKFKEPDED
jgi:hypothetical protein